MQRAPKPEIMFERLLSILKLEKSEFQQNSKRVKGVYTSNPRMTRGLTLNKQHLTGDKSPLRISVATHSGEGTGEGQILYSCGAREFAEKVWAIEAGIEAARVLGVKVGDL